MKLRELAAMICEKQKKNKAGKELTIAQCMSFLKALKNVCADCEDPAIQLQACEKVVSYNGLKAVLN